VEEVPEEAGADHHRPVVAAIKNLAAVVAAVAPHPHPTTTAITTPTWKDEAVAVVIPVVAIRTAAVIAAAAVVAAAVGDVAEEGVVDVGDVAEEGVMEAEEEEAITAVAAAVEAVT
jgi:hypothetical protein